MKIRCKLLTILLVTSVIISSISFGAFGEDSGKNAGIFAESKSTAANETEDAIQTSDGDEETNLIDETETVVFEFTEELPNNSRMIGDGGEVGFGPPEDDSSTTLLITSPILPDGVYAIESVSAPGLWIDVNNVTGPGHIVWQDYHSRPTNSFNRIALFKIKYVPNTQSYIIRLMTNNMLTLGISELNDVVTKTISSPYDDQVLPSETFTITRTVNGYIIKQYGYSDKAIASRFDVGGETYYPDSNLMYNYITEAGDKAKWNFYKYTGADKHGMILSYSSSYTSIGIPVGTTGTMGIKTWSTVIGSNIPQMQAASDSTAMISTANTSNVGEISFTALSPGYATVQSMIRNANSTTSQYTERRYFQIIPEEGTFFIENVGTGKYMDIESPYTGDGRAIQQWGFSTAAQKRWMIEHAGDGYVCIKSCKSGKYVGIVETNGIYRAGQYSAQEDYTLWKFNRTSSGNLKLECKAFSNTLVLAPPSNLNGADLALVTYTNDSDYKDEWKFDVSRIISYVNYYDSTFINDPVLRQNIAVANDFSQFVFSKYYNLLMLMDGSAIQYDTIIDDCTTGGNAPCNSITCGSDCNTMHHKNGWVISNQLYYAQREPNHIYVLWTNHDYYTYCHEESDSHEEVNWIAVVYEKRPVIHFMTIDGNESVQLARMAIILVHETAHTLKMNDVYDNAGHDQKSATVCVMEYFDKYTAFDFYQNVLNGTADPFCDSCHQAMSNHTSNISIPGN